MKNFYRVLGLGNCAPMAEVKKAYRALALKHHPDRGGDQEVMKEINEAYEVLMRNKEQYDSNFKPFSCEGFTIVIGEFGFSYEFAGAGTGGGTQNNTGFAF